MNIHIHLSYALVILTLLTGSCNNQQGENPSETPNIIYILADDLGYGDLGCYGQERFLTPHLDRLAESGMRFTRHYSGSTVCAPSRSVLMSGLHTGHTPIRGNQGVKPEGQAPLPDSIYTIAELLKEAGYCTGVFGKWGLGSPGSEGDPNNQGFDQFFGYNCQSLAHRYYPEHLWHNSDRVLLEGNDLTNRVIYAQDVIQEKTLEFIKENKENTFFAYIPVIIPHAELLVPDDSILEKFTGQYPETPYKGRKGADYGPDIDPRSYCSQENPHATFAAMVYRLDIYVGQIVSLLEELQISENTIIMFTSDNGPHQEGGADPVFFNSNGGLRGIKRDLYEGGVRVPFIVSWPGTIKGGTISNHISAFWDILPTVADIAGIESSLNDGISFLPELLGYDQMKHNYLYWEFHERGGSQAILHNEWKAVRLGVGKNPIAVLELYDLRNDPRERNNIADQHPDITDELAQMMDSVRIPSDKFNFGMKAIIPKSE